MWTSSHSGTLGSCNNVPCLYPPPHALTEGRRRFQTAAASIRLSRPERSITRVSIASDVDCRRWYESPLLENVSRCLFVVFDASDAKQADKQGDHWNVAFPCYSATLGLFYKRKKKNLLALLRLSLSCLGCCAWNWGLEKIIKNYKWLVSNA